MTWFPEQEANFIGASLMAGCSLFIFFGAFLRISCLYLALLVLSSTIAENLLMGSVQNPEALWRDVVFVSALMLVYGSMSRQGIGRVSLVKSVRKIRKIRVNQTRVMPRRVLSSKGPQLATGAVAVADNIISLPLFQGRNGDDSKDDVSNIFADVDFTASRAAT